jgi:hypothetical protein
MRIYTLEQENLVPCPLDQAFAFFGNPYNLNKITPPWLDFSILYAPQEIYRGCILYYRLKLHGVPITWVTQIVEWDPPRRFVDIQLIGRIGSGITCTNSSQGKMGRLSGMLCIMRSLWAGWVGWHTGYSFAAT